MQGVFAADEPLSQLSTKWGEVLDPEMDDETARVVQDEAQRARRAREAVAARDGRPVPELPGAPQPPLQKKVLMPPVHFTVKKRLFYVLRDDVDPTCTKPRPGKLGHYLVPCFVDSTNKTARPCKTQPKENPQPFTIFRGGPGDSSRDQQPSPDPKWCVEGRDFVCCPRPGGGAADNNYWEVGLTYLQRVLEEAEALDLAFARRMEGLSNVAPTVVWDCVDPDYDVSDRETVMSQFTAKYLDKFYARLDGSTIPSPEAVSAEAVHRHKVFCKAWVERHYRTLTPAVTAPAEALASEFYSHLLPKGVTRMELARVLMRHEEFASEFASALHYYTANLEQTRGARNASYKQMRLMSASRVTSYASLGRLLAAKELELRKTLAAVVATDADRYLHPLTVDWHAVLGQVPPVHRRFVDTTPYHGLSEARRATAEGRVPPWRFGRQPPPDGEAV